MVLAKSRVFGACVVSVALLVAGCSNGSSGDVAARGPCPKTYPARSGRFSLTAANTGVSGLSTKLVPFAAQRARVCSYDSTGRTLTGNVVLSQAATTRFEASTNRLENRTSQPTKLPCPEFATSLLTFTTSKEGVAVAVADCGGGIASNGPLTVDSTRAWLNEVAAYTAKQSRGG